MTAWLTTPDGQRWPLDQERVVIGREEPADVVIELPQISRQHAQITRIERSFYLGDLGSRNGTFVNGAAVVGEARRLQDADQIVLAGVLTLVYHDPGETVEGPRVGRLQGVWLDQTARTAWVDARPVEPELSAAQFALGHGQSSGQQNAGLSARLMGSTGGKALLVVVGLVVIAIGGYHIYKGATRRFLDDLKRGGDSPLIVWSGVIGYVAKGAALTGAGVLVIVAAVRADPAKATGIDGAVKTLAGLPAGQLLLVLAAFGIAAYGFYSFVMARHARM